eukprot:TRINITY_DN584_c2_g1_i1.p1 TRINITY_DN584_c2_g1~~TRINITY_DN584_c2_g1_i1.p1  ORF type:complete len:820 (+),score=92.58 TRINITY_DN584_c2_g1_i1:48-2462(+)
MGRKKTSKILDVPGCVMLDTSEGESPDGAARLRAENAKLKADLEELKAQLNQYTQTDEKTTTMLNSIEKKWSVTSIALAFIAGAIFVLADRAWLTSPFTAGVLYSIGTIILIFTVPALHATGTVKYSGYRVFQPFSGGVRFVVLQALSWAFYSLAVVFLLFAVFYGDETQLGLVSGSGVLGILSQVLMASSLQTFVAPSESKPLSKKCSVSQLQDVVNEGLDETPLERLSSEIFEDEDETDISEKEKPMDSFAELLTLNILLILIMLGLSFVSEFMGKALPAALSLLVTCVAVLLTHGLGGKILRLRGWTFFQPFAGGTQFVILQGVTWMLFTISLLCQLAFLYAVLYLGVSLTMGLMHVGGMAAVASEILCVISFRYFKGSKTRKRRDQRALKADKTLTEMPKISVWCTLVTVLVWNLQYLPFVAHVAVMIIPALLPISANEYLHEATQGIVYTNMTVREVVRATMIPITSIVIYMMNFSVMQTLGVPRAIGLLMSPPWVLFAGVYLVKDTPCFNLQACVMGVWIVYSITYIGDPDKGIRKRYDPNWTNTTSLWENMRMYFGGRVLVSKKLEKLLKKGKGPGASQHMVGYHPHGIIPSGMVWGMRCSEWKEKLPNFELTGLTASIMHYVPLMRDVIQWTGIREVSRKTLYRTIDEGLNPAVVVGGQSEMFLSRSRDNSIKIVRFHNGFFKIAVEKQVPVLPIFAFGETKIYDNIELPTIQKWSKSRLGFPIPFIPIGRWNLPVPRRKKVILAVGAPLSPPKSGSEAEVEAFKYRYFDAVQDLFDEFKDRAGYEHHRLEFIDKR